MAGKVVSSCGKAVRCVANLRLLPEAMCGNAGQGRQTVAIARNTASSQLASLMTLLEDVKNYLFFGKSLNDLNPGLAGFGIFILSEAQFALSIPLFSFL